MMNCIPRSPIKDRMIPSGAIPLNQITDNVMFFLGAGASIPAGLKGVVALVDDFRNYLQVENKPDYLEIIDKIIASLKNWKDQIGDKNKIDIELLLETVEKIENRDKDVLSIFYAKDTFTLSGCKGYELVSNGKRLLSEEIKAFVKTLFTETSINVEYLKALIDFIRKDRPLDIFSTNYDVCIEKLCRLNNKEYVDGFNPRWNPELAFNRPDIDVRLYKLHGSVTWYRTEQGDYESSSILIKGMKINLATGQEAIPFIVYPGKKLEYNEPTFDILVKLKRRLETVKYLFVIGYSFKDPHIVKMFRYAARKNDQLTLFLIGPSAHETYYHNLKRHIDDEFTHSSTNESFSSASFNTDVPSDLIGRVICLPYKFEKIADSLNDQYLYSVT